MPTFRKFFFVIILHKKISSNQIIHGDVAARNFVLDEFNENIILSDTIISVDLFPADYFEGRPIRWQAPECIETANHSSLSGDVWAFGIFVWELFSLAKGFKIDLDLILRLPKVLTPAGKVTN